jgi:hypothetical protein
MAKHRSGGMGTVGRFLITLVALIVLGICLGFIYHAGQVH